MHITLTPSRREQSLTLEKAGDTLIFNGASLDFSGLPEGATLPRLAIDCPWIAGDVTRENGILHISLILPHGASAPQETLFPNAMNVTQDGAVYLPPYATTQEVSS